MSFYKIKFSKSDEKFLKKNKSIGVKFLKVFEEINQNRENIKFYDIKKFHSKKLMIFIDDIFRKIDGKGGLI